MRTSWTITGGNMYLISPGWSYLGTGHWIVLFSMLIAAIIPYVMCFKNKTSIALATSISLLSVFVVQIITILIAWFGGPYYSVVYGIKMLPTIPLIQNEPGEWYRYITSAWIHSEGDFVHVLGNVLVITLVGVPLEQRLGARRFMAVYLIGAIGGGIAWVFFNQESVIPALGASGAAFGLLGAYLACWPNDEIEFPLILIRRWPVSLIALLYFGIEILRAFTVYGMQQASDVAHMAHFGGFIFCYVSARTIAKGGPIPLDISDRGPSQSSLEGAKRNAKLMKLGSLDQNPWNENGIELSHKASRTMDKLKEAGDEIETREAWLEKLSLQVTCPICSEPVKMVIMDEIPVICCTSKNCDLQWP